MSILAAKSLSKAYGARALLDGVTFTLREGEKVGLIGANGAGKSTLLRVLAGVEPADIGVVERRRGARVLFLPQEPELPAGESARAIVESGLLDAEAAITAREEASRAHLADEMLDHLGVREPDREVDSMSGGERRRVALARLLVARPEVAILDEPTNHLDTDTIEWLEQYLDHEFGGAVLLVTHDRYVLDAIADRVLELDRGKITEFEGGYADYLEQKAEMLAHESRVEQNRLNVLRRERAWLLRGAKARTTKQKARIQRAQALMAAEPVKQDDALSLRGVEAGAARLGKTVLDLEHVSLSVGERTLVSDLTLRMVSGERVGIIGPNGAGKTSLLRLASGELQDASSPERGSGGRAPGGIAVTGEVVRGAGTRFAYFDQARAILEDDWSVFDNVAEREGAERTGAGVVTLGTRTMEMRSYLEQFCFDGQAQRRKVGALSGGERARVALAKVLKSGANMLLLDEPTNDLDVSTLGALEEMLESWPGCALVVSHDRYFLNRVATAILAFEGDGRVTRYAGNYDAYLLQRKPLADARGVETRAAESAAAVPGRERQRAAPAPQDSGKKALTYAERLELDGIMDRIGEAEARVSALESQLADPALYASRAADARALSAELDAARQDVSSLTNRWEELESRRA